MGPTGEGCHERAGGRRVRCGEAASHRCPHRQIGAIALCTIAPYGLEGCHESTGSTRSSAPPAWEGHEKAMGGIDGARGRCLSNHPVSKLSAARCRAGRWERACGRVAWEPDRAPNARPASAARRTEGGGHDWGCEQAAGDRCTGRLCLAWLAVPLCYALRHRASLADVDGSSRSRAPSRRRIACASSALPTPAGCGDSYQVRPSRSRLPRHRLGPGLDPRSSGDPGGAHGGGLCRRDQQHAGAPQRSVHPRRSRAASGHREHQGGRRAAADLPVRCQSAQSTASSS